MQMVVVHFGVKRKTHEGASVGYANIRLVFTHFPCTVSPFTSPLWRVLQKQAPLAAAQLLTGGRKCAACLSGLFPGGAKCIRTCEEPGLESGVSGVSLTIETRLGEQTWSGNIAGTGQDVTCSEWRRDTPLTDKLNQHLPWKCCPPFHLCFPSLFWLV